MTGFYIEEYGQPYWMLQDGKWVTTVFREEQDAKDFRAGNWHRRHLRVKPLAAQPSRESVRNEAITPNSDFIRGVHHIMCMLQAEHHNSARDIVHAEYYRLRDALPPAPADIAKEALNEY